jgi:hypothetical protein
MRQRPCATGPVVLSSDVTLAGQLSLRGADCVRRGIRAGGTMMADKTKLSFKAYAALVSMTRFDSYGGTTDTSRPGDRPTAVSPGRRVQPSRSWRWSRRRKLNPYAAFATSNDCDAIYLHGSLTVDIRFEPGHCRRHHRATGGDLGSNGNLHVQGSVNVAGNLYTQTGVGEYSAGAVNRLTLSGSFIKLRYDVVFPLPPRRRDRR